MPFDLFQSLKTLAARIGLSDIEPDEDGHWELATDEFSVHIESVAETDSVFVYSLVGLMPEDPPVELLSHLLHANFFTRETAGATLGVDKFSDSIVLFVRWPQSELDHDSFEQRLLDFFEATDLWVKRIDGWLITDTFADESLGSEPEGDIAPIVAIRA
jgi:hypothetical protein